MEKRYHSIEDVVAYLDAIPKFKEVGANAIDLGLEPLKRFCEKVGSPHEQYKTIHVAGTNGKGTTCYLLSEAYIAQGYKVGLYSSPHLMRYNERVQINGEEILDEDLLRFFNEYHVEIEAFGLSYFEISTALAFWYFNAANVDIAIIETGLGGRLDATNIVSPELSIITSISLDHTDILGDTIEEIAYEKAGIIKENTPVIVGNMPSEALKVIKDIAYLKHANLITIDELNPQFQNTFTIQVNNDELDLGSGLKEPINRFNYALAWLGLNTSSIPLDKQKVIEAWRSIEQFIGRFEKFDGLNWFFCGAHNVESYSSLMDTMSTLPGTPVIIFASMRDKLNEELFEYLNRLEYVYYYELEGNRAALYNEVHKCVPKAQNISEMDVLNKLNDLRDVLVIFTGSFYFYQTVKHWTGRFVT